jgi:hypothetical protein
MPKHLFSVVKLLGENMAKMTEEEADALDERYTKNPPKVDPAKKGGFFTDQRELLKILEKAAAEYIMAQAESANKLPAQIINEIVRERVTRTKPVAVGV